MAISQQIGTTIAIYLLVVPLIIFYGLLLAGCVSSSPGLSNLYMIQLQKNNETIVRIGYFGLCELGTNGSVCVWTGFSSNDSIAQELQDVGRISDDTVNEALKLQGGAFLNLLAPGAILFLLSLIMDLLRVHSTRRQRGGSMTSSAQRRQNFYRQFSLALAWGASAFTLATATANTQTAKALEISSEGSVSSGQTSLGLLWTTWAFSFLLGTGLTVLHRSRSGAMQDLRGHNDEFSNFDDTQMDSMPYPEGENDKP